MFKDPTAEVVIELVTQLASCVDAQQLVRGLIYNPMSAYDLRSQLMYTQLLINSPGDGVSP